MTPEQCQEILRGQGLCGELSPDRLRACIRTGEHIHDWMLYFCDGNGNSGETAHDARATYLPTPEPTNEVMLEADAEFWHGMAMRLVTENDRLRAIPDAVARIATAAVERCDEGEASEPVDLIVDGRRLVADFNECRVSALAIAGLVPVLLDYAENLGRELGVSKLTTKSSEATIASMQAVVDAAKLHRAGYPSQYMGEHAVPNDLTREALFDACDALEAAKGGAK